MEDISSLIWLGIVIVWFLSRLVRRGVKKAVRSQQQQKAPPMPSRPAQQPSQLPTEPQKGRFRKQPDYSGRGGTGPPPIVPR